MIDHSRPASGGEHHISHPIEMDFIAEGRKQVLHGAKVGVASAFAGGLVQGPGCQPSCGCFGGISNLAHVRADACMLTQVGSPSTIAELGVTEGSLRVHSARLISCSCNICMYK
ncbi:hypothetical protein [Paenibacillus sp. NPDC055715]